MVGHTTPYLYQKRGVYYFSRRVPEDLLCHYKQSKIVFSLRTKSIKAARVKVDLSRFNSVSLNGIISIKENNYGTSTHDRI
jgi:hypothetical protein